MMKMEKPRRFGSGHKLAAFFAASLLAFAGSAEVIDLAGVDATATDLADDTVYTNSSETAASLVFDCADDVTFNGTIGGNLALVKQGAGKLALNGTNTYVCGTFVSNGWLTVGADRQVAGGAVSLAGGNLRLAAVYTPSTACFTLDADATVDTGAFLFGVKPATFVTKGHTMTKVGYGELKITATFTAATVGGSTWIIDEGKLTSGGDGFGGYVENMDMTLELHEGTHLRSDHHLPLPARLVLRGATLRGSQDFFTNAESTHQWKNFSFNKSVTVLPSADGRPSVINALAVHMGQRNFTPTFDVREGAELQVNAQMVQGLYGSTNPLLPPGTFVKKGAGTMYILQPGTLKGTVRLDEGTLRFGKDGGLGKGAVLAARPGTKVVLDDGAALDCRYCGDSILSSAEVWIDATRFNAEDGATVDSIPNFGTCGGNFLQFATCNNQTSKAPTFTVNAFNGRPAFDFDGHQALALDTYTNKTSEITVFVAARCTHWEAEGNKGKWSSLFAGHSTAAPKNDYESYGSFYQQDAGSYAWYVGNRQTAGLASHAQITNGTPFIDCMRRDGTSVNLMQYRYGETAAETKTVSGVSAAYDVNRLGLACRLGTNAKCEYYGDNHASSRLWYGQVGEVLVFSRVLSDDERAVVNEYLRRKWHNTTNDAVSIASLYSGRQDVLEVPAGAAALVSERTEAGATLTKTGAGTLRVNAMSGVQDVRVAEGTLELLPTSVVAHIDVWMDAADASAVTTNADGRIAAVRNKGNAGGMFAASPLPASASNGAPTPVWEQAAINGLPVLKFAGDSALVLDSYSNTNAFGFLTIFMVAERSSDIQFNVPGRGKWSAPFSMASRSSSSPDEAQLGAYHYDEKQDDTGEPYGQFYRGNVIRAKVTNLPTSVPNDEAFVFASYTEGYRQLFYFERTSAEVGGGSVYKNTFTWDLPQFNYNFDRIQLGCRMGTYGRALLYGVGNSSTRAWYGRIGEFIVCTATLSDAEKSAILGYLRKKWMDKGAGSASAPAVLTGTALAGALGADTSLTLAAGTTVASGAATQPIASLAAEAPATLARSAVTNAADYALFNVSGDVTLPAAMTFRADALPDAAADVLTYGGALNTSETAWTVASDKPSAHIFNTPGRIRLNPLGGFYIILR